MDKLLLFDIDGTLLRVKDATRLSMNETFQSLFHLDKSIDDISTLARTDLELFREAAMTFIGRPMNPAEYAEFEQGYLKRLAVRLDSCVHYLMPGVAGLLDALAARPDVLLALETGNLEAAAYLKLKTCGIDRYFHCGGFGTDSAERAELVRIGIQRASAYAGNAFAKENIYVIGDAPHDVLAGKELGVRTIAVGTGFCAREDLLAAGPDGFFEDLSDNPRFFRCIGLVT